MRVRYIICVKPDSYRKTKYYGIFWVKKFGKQGTFMIIATSLVKLRNSIKPQYRWTIICPDGTFAYIEKE